MLSVTAVLKYVIFGYSHSLLLLFSVKLWASSVVLFCGILPLKFSKPSQPPTPSLASYVGLPTVYMKPHTGLLLPSLPLQFWTTGVGRFVYTLSAIGILAYFLVGLETCSVICEVFPIGELLVQMPSLTEKPNTSDMKAGCLAGSQTLTTAF